MESRRECDARAFVSLFGGHLQRASHPLRSRLLHADRVYPGLVVHGPLQATLLLDLATEGRDGVPPQLLSFRGAQPLFDGAAFSLSARESGSGLELWTESAAGRQAMTATANW